MLKILSKNYNNQMRIVYDIKTHTHTYDYCKKTKRIIRIEKQNKTIKQLKNS